MIKPRKTRAPERSDRKVVRCAVYTRKSTEEGLDQDFNSLDAQRESAEAYIRSQAHEGWRLVTTRYDDGGGGKGSGSSFSGNSGSLSDGTISTADSALSGGGPQISATYTPPKGQG